MPNGIALHAAAPNNPYDHALDVRARARGRSHVGRGGQFFGKVVEIGVHAGAVASTPGKSTQGAEARRRTASTCNSPFTNASGSPGRFCPLPSPQPKRKGRLGDG